MKNELTIPINIIEIMRYLPHRYPFLLIDRVLGIEVGKKIVTLKNVTINEPFFVGHFDAYPVMPGVLIIEAMAQSAGVLAVFTNHTNNSTKEKELYFFASIDKAKFKRQVMPGDTLKIEVELIKVTQGMSKYMAKAFVENNLMAEAELMIARKEM
jgi:3-hydroxyacyl-[acyl-carrier-protein] dehydratase